MEEKNHCQFFKNSNFLTLPELLRVLTHLIAIAGSGPWRGLQTAQK